MSWVRAAAISDIPADGGHRCDIGDLRVALFRVGDRVYAVGDRCSHAEASLSEGEVVDTEVECPRHGALFDLTDGSALSLPATRSIPTYDVRVDDDVVFVEVAS